MLNTYSWLFVYHEIPILRNAYVSNLSHIFLQVITAIAQKSLLAMVMFVYVSYYNIADVANSLVQWKISPPTQMYVQCRQELAYLTIYYFVMVWCLTALSVILVE